MPLKDRNPASCFIELLPKVEGDHWNGELEVNIITDSENPLNDESYSDLIHLSQLVASTVALMERDVTLVDRLEAFVHETEENLKKVNKPTVIKKVEGNVVSISFQKETKH
jgi:hypothetical protein|tara:strand:+ start:354 stop:686 length:333 start_codon:yes stop_codon:yes gene_type:complete